MQGLLSVFEEKPEYLKWAGGDVRSLVLTLRDYALTENARKLEDGDEDKWRGMIATSLGQMLERLSNLSPNSEAAVLALLSELKMMPQVWGFDPHKPNDCFHWASFYFGENAYRKYGVFFDTKFQGLLEENMPGVTIPDVFVRDDGTLAPVRVAQLAADEIGQRSVRVTPEEFVEIASDLHDSSVDQAEYKRRRANRDRRRSGQNGNGVEKGRALVLERDGENYLIVVSLRGRSVANGFLRHAAPYVPEYKNAASTDEVIRMVTDEK